MVKLSQKFVRKLLDIYKPVYRYLRSAEIEFPRARGTFLVPYAEYLNENIGHFTNTEACICLNQLCYVFFAHGVKEGIWNNINLEEFLSLRNENMFIVSSNYKFRRVINPRETNINGQIELIKLRKCKDFYIAKLDFSFENKVIYGNLELILKLK
ncbi:hypothetical protein HYV49_05375 [Candidatus Pacearchaeota archaeon]|nr:hypothetical protein [Candidatus Pacearchaeota archaeon]